MSKLRGLAEFVDNIRVRLALDEELASPCVASARCLEQSC